MRTYFLNHLSILWLIGIAFVSKAIESLTHNIPHHTLLLQHLHLLPIHTAVAVITLLLRLQKLLAQLMNLIVAFLECIWATLPLSLHQTTLRLIIHLLQNPIKSLGLALVLFHWDPKHHPFLTLGQTVRHYHLHHFHEDYNFLQFAQP